MPSRAPGSSPIVVAPDGKAGRQLVRGLFSQEPITAISGEPARRSPGRLKATFEDAASRDDDLRALGKGLIARLAGESTAQAADPRITRLLAWLSPRLEEPVSSLADAATQMGLSPGARGTCRAAHGASVSAPICSGNA